MWMHAAIVCAAAWAASPGPIPEGEFEAVVTAVIGGDAVRVSAGDGDALMGLYGVSLVKRPRAAAAAASDFVRERTADTAITVRPIKVVAGMPYVEIILPTGEVLNHLLLTADLADLDLLTAAGDEVYAALIGADAPPAGEAPLAGQPVESASPTESPAQVSLEEFRMRRYLRELAAFEAGLEKWAAMPPAYRESVRRHYEEALAAADSGGAELLESLRSRVAARQDALVSAREGISERRTAIEVDREVLARDPDLQWNTRRYQEHLSDYYANRAAGLNWSTRRSARLAERYRVRAGFDQARVDAEYEARRREHETAIRSLTAEQRAQAEALRQANTRLRAAAVQTSDRVARYLRALVQFDLYDQAIEGDMLPTLPMRPVAVLEGTEAQRSAPFLIESPLGRVDWYADPQRPDAQFSGVIHSVADDRPVAHFRSSNPPHESYLLLDGPGEFYAAIDTAGPVLYLVDVFAIEGE